MQFSRVVQSVGEDRDGRVGVTTAELQNRHTGTVARDQKLACQAKLKQIVHGLARFRSEFVREKDPAEKS